VEAWDERSCFETMDPIRASVATISDKGYAGQREDVSGPLLVRLLQDLGAEVVEQTVVPDEQEAIVHLLTTWLDRASEESSLDAALDLIVTTGGTGVTPRDVTPEATKSIIELEVPGLSEALRFTGYGKTPLAVISRGVAGICGRTLIINLPGSPSAVRDGMETLAPILPHVIRMIRGQDTEHHHALNSSAFDERRAVLSVEEAQEAILSTVEVLGVERVPLLAAVGRVLAETVSADRNIPPMTNAAMDGYAVRGTEVARGALHLRVVGHVAAGHEAGVVIGPGEAVRIMTGAPIPAGADTVVRFEDTRMEDDHITVFEPPLPGENVRQAGEDVQAGEQVLEQGTLLRPQEIGMLAAVGRTEVAVFRRPRVAILGTGDEVVSPAETPGPSQIRDANSYAVAAQVQRWGGVAMVLGVARDQEELVRQGIRQALELQADFIITSGGVSVGDFDLVKQVMDAEGEMRFWSLNMKPGRPMAFGAVGGIPLLGLPGNPVAAMISAELYARPALLKMQGHADWSLPAVRARLTHSIERKDGRRHYLRVALRETSSGYEAMLTGDQGSGILKSMVQADGLAVIPETARKLPAGSEVEVILLH